MSKHETLLPSFTIKSRRFAAGVLLALLSAILQRAVGAWYTSLCVFALLFIALGAVRFRLPGWARVPVTVLVFLAASCVSYYASQYAYGSLELLGKKAILLGILFCATVLLFLLMLLARPFPALCVGMVFLQFFTTVNWYVYKCRGTDFVPTDIISAGTAMSVVGNYDLTPNLYFVRAWLIVVLFLFGVSALHLGKLKRGRLTMITLPAVCLMSFVFMRTISTMSVSQWAHEGTYTKGYFVTFMRQVQLSIAHPPEGYDAEELAILTEAGENPGNDPTPTIIVIMNESFANPGVLSPNFRTDVPLTPVLDSLQENAIKGYALASIYGGNTTKSEYEFLTGNSVAFLPSGSVPYQQYIRQPTWSMVSELKGRGYQCLAMHPFAAGGYRRDKVYPLLGFDKCHFQEDFGNAERLRDFISDRGMYEYLIQRYEEERKDGRPLFIFGVTMQNHGQYSFGEEIYPTRVHVEGLSGTYPTANEYLTLVHDSDAALGCLVEYFSQADDKVVLVFFGDHQANLGSQFLNELQSGAAKDLDEKEKDYLVPFLIWANYDIEEREIPLTSLNYLSNYVYEAAGITPPAWNRVLAQIQEVIPAINALGYYSAEEQRFLQLSEATGEEKKLLDLYAQFVYNSVFDKKGRLSIFEP